VLYHSFCRALNKQVPLLKLQLYKLKIYALTVCILSMCSRLPLTAFFWYAGECVFVKKKKKKAFLSQFTHHSFNHRITRSISTFYLFIYLFKGICIIIGLKYSCCIFWASLFLIVIMYHGCNQDYKKWQRACSFLEKKLSFSNPIYLVSRVRLFCLNFPSLRMCVKSSSGLS